jgi:hypothetical protein
MPIKDIISFLSTIMSLALLTIPIIAAITSLIAAFASIISLIVSERNTRFARFASEKWWERKSAAYYTIIEALSDLVYYYDQKILSELSERELSQEQKQALDSHWESGHLRIQKAANIGSFMISSDAEAC